MGVFSQLVANGLIAGGIYALVAVGYTLVYGVLKFINFAHGEIFMIGAYVAWFLNASFGVNIFISLLVSVIICALLGYTIEKVAYKPLRGRDRLIPLITAVAMSLFLQGLVILLFGAEIKTFKVHSPSYNILGASVTGMQIIIIITAVVLMLLTHFFIKKTKTGKAIRAVSDSNEVASVVGINVDRTISSVFILGSILAAVAGVLVGMEQNLTPTMGISVGIKAFTAAVVGGIGNIYGAFVGGILIGLAENLGIWFIPSGYKDAIAFVILLLMLMFKPNGLFGLSKEARA